MRHGAGCRSVTLSTEPVSNALGAREPAMAAIPGSGYGSAASQDVPGEVQRACSGGAGGCVDLCLVGDGAVDHRLAVGLADVTHIGC